MKRHLNTLFITTQGSYLSKDGEAVDVRVDHESKLRVPVINLGGIVCFGQVSASPALLALCAGSDVAVTFLSENGRFLARVCGFSPGNVLLRREQYRRADDLEATLAITRNMVAAKIANSRTVLLRAVRDWPEAPTRSGLEHAANRLTTLGTRARVAGACDGLLGIEGEAASVYFGVFNGLLSTHASEFAFTSRSRRPPLDPINALLSFLYAMLGHDARAACESCGLDSAVGFMHRDKSGRAGLALDLIEEFRAFLADRLAVSLINRQQVRADGFRTSESGGVEMDDATRRIVLTAYQERKQEVITHPFLGEKTTVGLLLHLQARLLARFLRGDLDSYPPFIWK